MDGRRLLPDPARRGGARWEEFKYLQIIGYDRAPGAEPADAITGWLYTSNGDTLLYTCEADDKTLTIWFGEKGSLAVYRGEWSDDGNTLTANGSGPAGATRRR